MSKNARTRHLLKHVLPRVALMARVLVPACLVFVATLCPCVTPGLGLFSVSESEAPVDEGQSSEEQAISLQARTRMVINPPSSPLAVPVHGGFCATTANVASLPHSGHRLSNHLLAPLRC